MRFDFDKVSYSFIWTFILPNISWPLCWASRKVPFWEMLKKKKIFTWKLLHSLTVFNFVQQLNVNILIMSHHTWLSLQVTDGVERLSEVQTVLVLVQRTPSLRHPAEFVRSLSFPRSFIFAMLYKQWVSGTIIAFMKVFSSGIRS